MKRHTRRVRHAGRHITSRQAGSAWPGGFRLLGFEPARRASGWELAA